jgi:hypothetical protein
MAPDIEAAKMPLNAIITGRIFQFAGKEKVPYPMVVYISPTK